MSPEKVIGSEAMTQPPQAETTTNNPKFGIFTEEQAETFLSAHFKFANGGVKTIDRIYESNGNLMVKLTTKSGAILNGQKFEPGYKRHLESCQEYLEAMEKRNEFSKKVPEKMIELLDGNEFIRINSVVITGGTMEVTGIDETTNEERVVKYDISESENKGVYAKIANSTPFAREN